METIENKAAAAAAEKETKAAVKLNASVAPDVKRLRDYTKIYLEPGQTKTVSFDLKADDLSFVDHSLNWVLEEGEFRLACGSESVLVNCIKGR